MEVPLVVSARPPHGRRQGLFRRSRSFGTGGPVAATSSVMSPLKRIPRRSTSSGPAKAAALMQVHVHPNNDMEIPSLLSHSNSQSVHKYGPKLYQLFYLCIIFGLGTLFLHRGSGTIQTPNSAFLRTVHLQTQLLQAKTAQLLLTQNITTLERLEDPTSPAHEAFHWLLESIHSSPDRPFKLRDSEIIARFALATLYFATHSTGSVWTRGEHQWVHTQQQQSPFICDWYGITCATTNVVTEVKLPANQLQGTLPDEVFAGLTNLVAFDVSNNSLWGSIPTRWDTSPFLQTLYLHNNALTGTIPEKLRTMKNILQSTGLKHVKLSYNHFAKHHLQDKMVV